MSTEHPPKLPLDPRTVSPAVLIEGLAGRRPAIAVASLLPQFCALSLWDAKGTTQVSKVYHPRLAGEGDAALLSRLLPVCAARLLVIANSEQEHDDLPALAAPFDHVPLLGAAVAGRERFCVRGEIWTALGGLDGSAPTLADARQDLFAKAAALGFAVPGAAARRAEADCNAPAAIYTAITAGYDSLKPQPRSFAEGQRQVAFLDDASAELHKGRSRGWEIMTGELSAADPRRASRYWKANAHLALPDARISLWVDASITIVAPMSLARLAGLFLAERDVCVFSHHARHCIAEEAAACKALRLDAPEVIDAQLARYASEGFPDEELAELPVILRRHTPAVRALNEAWWAEILAGSHRDQLSFNYVAWKTGVRYEKFPLSLAVRNGLFVKLQRPQADRETSN